MISKLPDIKRVKLLRIMLHISVAWAKAPFCVCVCVYRTGLSSQKSDNRI